MAESNEWIDAVKWAESVEHHADDCMCPSCIAVSRARMVELDASEDAPKGATPESEVSDE